MAENLLVFVILNSSIPFKCIWFDVFCFYLWSIRLIWCILFLFEIDAVLEKWSSIFVMLVKEKRLSCDHLIETSCLCILELSLLFVLACQRRVFEEIIQIRTMVSLYSVFVDKYEKTKFSSNNFSWSHCYDCYAFIWSCVAKRVPLFEHMSTIEVIWVW